MQEAIAYAKHKNLKLAAAELGMSFHTLYARLRKAGVHVTGDKSRYGTSRDRLAVLGEHEFQRLVPDAEPMNEWQFQAKFDFLIYGHKVDVKASLPRQLNKKHSALSWAFSFKKQTLICDYICCFCLGEDKRSERVLLVPAEFFAGIQTVSVSCNGKSKWHDYDIKPDELADFFASMKGV